MMDLAEDGLDEKKNDDKDADYRVTVAYLSNSSSQICLRTRFIEEKKEGRTLRSGFNAMKTPRPSPAIAIMYAKICIPACTQTIPSNEKIRIDMAPMGKNSTNARAMTAACAVLARLKFFISLAMFDEPVP